MEKLSAVDSLKESIRLLEIRQAEEEEILKEQFKITYESLKPVNLIKSSLHEILGSHEIKNNLFETMVSIFTGFISKKIMVSSKSNFFTKIMGAMLQFGVTTIVAKNAESIRIFIIDLIDKFLHPEEKEIPETEVWKKSDN